MRCSIELQKELVDSAANYQCVEDFLFSVGLDTSWMSDLMSELGVNSDEQGCLVIFAEMIKAYEAAHGIRFTDQERYDLLYN